MAKRKLQRFAEIETFPNVFQHVQTEERMENFKLKGKWNNEWFKNNHPIVLELGCGKGEYTVGMVDKFKNKNFIGIDLKGNRIWRGAKTALENNMNNVAFLRTRIENIQTVFDKNEVSEIWITFPDPQPQKSREKKRLTSPRFIDYYKNLLMPDGIIHLKTDNFSLHQYTLDVIKSHNYQLLKASDDLYKNSGHLPEEVISFQSYYEKMFLEQGLKITYLSFKIAQ